PATLRTQANSIITALADSQFAPNAAVVMNGGSLALGTTSQSLGMLQALNGTITGSDSGGLLAASQPSGFLNSTLDNLNVNFGAETELANTHADIRGLATASVTFQSGSVLEVRNRSFGGASEMQFSKDLLMRNGTTFLLNVGSPGDVALIDIDG